MSNKVNFSCLTMKWCFVIYVSILLTFLTACTGDRTRANARAAMGPAGTGVQRGLIRTEQFGQVTVRSVVYRPTEFPLSTFFKRLADGDFKQAFYRVSLRYTPSNTDNKALKILLDYGFVPALIIVSNGNSRPQDLAGLKITLDAASKSYAPISAADLPSQFEKIDWPGFAIDVLEFPFVMAAITALTFAYITTSGEAIAQMGGFHFGDEDLGKHGQKVVGINYDMRYLFSPDPLGPGETRAGLIFFHVDKASEVTNLSLTTSWTGPK